MYFNILKISKNLKKEIILYIVSFFFAWAISALFSDFPFFRDIIKSLGVDSLLTIIEVGLTKFILLLFNFDVFTQDNFLKILGTQGVIFTYGCLGMREYLFFIVFIVFQKGKVINKLWYIPAGTLFLILFNAIRAAFIAYGQYKNPTYTQLIHDVVSPLLMYPAIFILWIIWLNVYSKKE
jgi:exosortase/archaeosortase family protein